MIVVPQTAKQNAKSSTRKKSSTQNRRRAEDRLLGRHRRSDAPCYVLRRRWRTLDGRSGAEGGSGLFKEPPLLATYRRNHNGPGTTLDQILISCCTPLRLLLVPCATPPRCSSRPHRPPPTYECCNLLQHIIFESLGPHPW